jgi:hypothetical protein
MSHVAIYGAPMKQPVMMAAIAPSDTRAVAQIVERRGVT